MRLALLALLLLAVPSAVGQVPAAQSGTLTVFTEDPGRAFLPGSVEVVMVSVTYGPGQTGKPTPAPTPDRPENTTPTRVTLEVKSQPSWVTDVTFDPPEVLFALPLHNVTVSTYQRYVRALLNVSPDAPALVREPFIVTATAEPNGNIPAMSAESPDMKVRAATVGRLNVTAEPSAVVPGGRWTVIPYTVTNQGNSDIVAKINVTVRPENSQVEFPETLQLARNESRVVEVRLRTPWTAAEFGSLELEATPIVDAEEGTAARMEVQVRGESAVPFPFLGVLGALLVAALVPSRLRR